MRPLLNEAPFEAGIAQLSPSPVAMGEGLIVQRYTPIYRVDGVVRRAAALQATVLAGDDSLALHPEDALALGVGQSSQVAIGGQRYACHASAEVPRGVCRVPSGYASTAALPATGQRIQIEQVSHG